MRALQTLLYNLHICMVVKFLEFVLLFFLALYLAYKRIQTTYINQLKTVKTNQTSTTASLANRQKHTHERTE